MIKQKTERYGIFGGQTIIRDENGFIERLVIIQDRGLFGGAPPKEMRIHAFIPFDDLEFGKEYLAELNEKTDLPFHLAKVKIQVTEVLD